MSDLVLVDRMSSFVDLLSTRLELEGHAVTGLSDPRSALALARARSENPPDVVIAELVFPGFDVHGLDVLACFQRWCPESALLVLSAAEGRAAPVLRLAWEWAHISSAVSKYSPLSTLTRTIDAVLENGRFSVDPNLGWLLPGEPGSVSSVDRCQRLVPDARSARFWLDLLVAGDGQQWHEPSRERVFDAVAAGCPGSVVAELQTYGIEDPTRAELSGFARIIRPLIVPLIRGWLGEEAAVFPTWDPDGPGGQIEP